ncbi:putative bifunctional diguanylate cyclase/phosphodiesterase [Thiohalorhabdus denitrificans]|uniref:PAS domain S-box-containing protein/diguanylate cyclase (GGDEF) domain-containing protein n=1 Tax=Thiohalorhabdus denitrificans TaxID=381306 RepID=A0A1G5B0B4_9GAMM|nr:EAL domain-containing protein [Thiohalorhabdus denitrificans]SCX83520.1 PAS domain S-box-containing protein/diguanylate cyclase (GGDEF) domain-containing protein [Thiohalorhabdus denitrificans]
MEQESLASQVPIEWNAGGGRLTFHGLDAVLLWKHPSLLSFLKPLREALGEDLFALLVANEASKGAHEDFHHLMADRGEDLAEGFANWGRAASGAGWGVFWMEEMDREGACARVRVDRPWELSLFWPENRQNAVPFLGGKLSGLFSRAFAANCRTRVAELGQTADGPYVLLDIAASPETLDAALQRLLDNSEPSLGSRLPAVRPRLREELNRFIEVVEATGEFVWETDRGFRLTYVTGNLGRVLGTDANRLRGEDFRALLTPDSRGALEQLLERGPEGRSGRECEVAAWTAAGAVRHLLLAATPTRDRHGEVTGLRGVGRDFTDQKRDREAIQRSHQRLERQVTARTRELERLHTHTRQLLESIGEGIFGVDEEGSFTFINPAGAEMLGYAPEELEGRDSRLLSSNDRGSRSGEDFSIRAVLADGKPRRRSEEFFFRKDGTAFLVELYAAPVREEGRVAGAVVSFRDIRDRKEAEEALVARAYYDELTGLPNRTHLIEQAERTLGGRSGGEGKVALILLNLDRFKDINDSFGHAAGDWLLQRVAARLYHRSAPHEKLARLHGDELACLAVGVESVQEGAAAARRFLESFAEPFAVGDHTVATRATAGISVFPDHGRSAEVLLQNAEAALHEAKKKGRGGYRFYSPDMTRAASRRVRVEAELRRSLDERTLAVHFQPQVKLSTGDVVGAEALVRWRHPEWGWVSPGHFIPVAERTGMIHPLGREVLRAACVHASRWRSEGLQRVAVNLSPVQLEGEGLEEELRESLAEADLPPEALELEVTEEVFLRDPDRASRVLSRFREQGIQVAIDDFGTGYSSLAYLKVLPVDRLKMDRSFVQSLPDDSQDVAITQSVATLARELGLEVVAEGVETCAQARFLRETGVQQAQGFLYGAALPPERWEGILNLSR